MTNTNRLRFGEGIVYILYTYEDESRHMLARSDEVICEMLFEDAVCFSPRSEHTGLPKEIWFDILRGVDVDFCISEDRTQKITARDTA